MHSMESFPLLWKNHPFLLMLTHLLDRITLGLEIFFID